MQTHSGTSHVHYNTEHNTWIKYNADKHAGTSHVHYNTEHNTWIKYNADTCRYVTRAL